MKKRHHPTHSPSHNSISWKQWGKALFAFTIASAAYGMAKALGLSATESHKETNTSSSSPNIETSSGLLSVVNVPDFSLISPLNTFEDRTNQLLTLSAALLVSPRTSPMAFGSLGWAFLNALSLTEAAFPATIDLATLNSSMGVVLQGAAGGDETGFSVASVGDINGDGLSDILVGAHWANPLGRTSAGMVYVIFGRNASWPTTLDLAVMTAANGVIIQGAADYDYTGYSTASAGDVNGDGLPDILVGARYADPLERTWAGVVYVIFGRNGSWPAILDLAVMTAADGVIIQGAANFDYTGRSAASAGDINGDGLPDILVGAYAADPLGRTRAGVLYVIFGRNGTWPATLDLANITATDGVIIQGTADRDYTGYSAASVGDINGDALPDILVGAYGANPLGRTSAGVAYIIFGRNGTWPATLDLANITATDGVIFQGAADYDYTGYSAASAGDVNGDGLPDMLLGAYGANPMGRQDAGVAYVIFGRNGTWPATLDLANITATDGVILQGTAGEVSTTTGSQNGDQTGISVAGVGDVNGDGLTDVLVGANAADPLGRNDAGVAYVIYGRIGSWPASLDLATLTATDGIIVQGAGDSDNTGISVASAGDINGDGAPDILLGADKAAPLGRNDSGSVYIIFGQSPVLAISSFSSGTTVMSNSTALTSISATPFSVATSSSASTTLIANNTVLSMGTSTSTRLAPQTSSISAAGSSSSPLKMGSSSLPLTNTSSTTKLTSQPYASTTTYSSVKSSIETSASVMMDSPTAGKTITSPQISFTVYVGDTPIKGEVDVQVFITSEDLFYDGIVDPNQVVYTISGETGSGIIIEVNGNEVDEFTQADVEGGFVSITLTEEYCEGNIELDVTNGGESKLSATLEISADIGECGVNAQASRVTEKTVLKGLTLLMVSSGLGFFAKQHREKVSSAMMSPLSDETKTDNEVCLSNLKSGY